MVNDHYPYEKWLFHWEYTLFSDNPIWCRSFSAQNWLVNPVHSSMESQTQLCNAGFTLINYKAITNQLRYIISSRAVQNNFKTHVALHTLDPTLLGYPKL